MSNEGEGDKILFLCFHGAGSLDTVRFQIGKRTTENHTTGIGSGKPQVNNIIVRRCQLPGQFTKLRAGAYDDKLLDKVPLKKYPIKLMENILEGKGGERECFASQNPEDFQEYHDLEMLFDGSIDDIGVYEFTRTGTDYYLRRLNIPGGGLIMKLSDLEDQTYEEIIDWFLGGGKWEDLGIHYIKTDDIREEIKYEEIKYEDVNSKFGTKNVGILCLIGCSPMSNSGKNPRDIEQYCDFPPLKPLWVMEGRLTSQFFTTNYLRTPALKSIVKLRKNPTGPIGQILVKTPGIIPTACQIQNNLHTEFNFTDAKNYFNNFLTARSLGLFNEVSHPNVKDWISEKHYQSHFNLHISCGNEGYTEESCKPMINPPLNKSPTLTRSLTRTITQEEKKDIKDLRDSAKPMVCEC